LGVKSRASQMQEKYTLLLSYVLLAMREAIGSRIMVRGRNKIFFQEPSNESRLSAS
jgi:hypothetical protein